MPDGLEMIVQELKDANDGGLDSEDDKYVNGELPYAAASYLLRGRSTHQIPMYWPWCDAKWNPTPQDHRIELAKAGALIVSEINRLNRLQEKKNGTKDMESHRP